MARPFRFGVTMRWAGGGTRWREVARHAEELGYDVVLVTDHMGAQLAAIPAMMSAADATTRLRVGSFVFSNDYRNPVMLAKEIATIDALSGGRVEFGLGAGWSTRDYVELGIPYDAGAVRVARMEEAVTLVKRLLTEDVVDHAGKYYTVRRARILPRPVQRPRPPLMIGGGSPRVLRIAAREADIVSFAPQIGPRGRPRLESLSAASLSRSVAALRAAAAGRASELELNVWLLDAAVTDRARSLTRAIAAHLKWAANAVVRTPFVLYGSRAALRDQLLERRETLGISYISIPGDAMGSFAPIIRDLR